MEIYCFAKINWALKVLNKREDNYHNLDMIMQCIDLYDRIIINKSDVNRLFVDDIFVEKYQDNLVFKTINYFNNYFNFDDNYNISLYKKIPSGAGLGGGSSDAAAVLNYLAKLKHISLSKPEFMNIASKIGADVPFFLEGKFSRVEGIGENINTYHNYPKGKILLIYDDIFISTKDIFENINKNYYNLNNISIDKIYNYIIEGDYISLKNQITNSLYYTAIEFNNRIETILNDFYDNKAIFAQMTGSGSSVFGIFKNDIDLNKAYENMKKKYRVCTVCNLINKSFVNKN